MGMIGKKEISQILVTNDSNRSVKEVPDNSRREAFVEPKRTLFTNDLRHDSVSQAAGREAEAWSSSCLLEKSWTQL